PAAAARADDLGRWRQGKRVRARRPGWAWRVARRATRRPLLTAAVVLLVCASAAAPALWPQPTPQPGPAPLEVAADRLRRGEDVVLLGPTGSPVSASWALGGSAAQTTAAADKPFAVHSWTLSLLELLPDPQCQRYRLRGEIKQDKGDQLGEVGVYLARRRTLTQAGDIDSFLQFTFNDIHDSTEGLQELAKKFPDKIFP